MRQFFKDIKKYRSYISYSVKCGLKSEVAESYLNWVWWVLEPFCLMLIYAFIFGILFERTENYFPVFIFAGLTGWNFFSNCVKHSVKLVKKYKSVVSRVYLPKVLLILIQIGINFVKMCISLALCFAMMLFFRVPVAPVIFMIIPVMIVLIIFTFAVMCYEMHFGVYVDDLVNVTGIVLRLLFYMTGIFFSIEERLGGKYPELTILLGKVNPVAYLLTSLRQAMIYCTMPDLKLLGLWFLISVVLSIFGINLIYKNENSYVKAI